MRFVRYWTLCVCIFWMARDLGDGDTDWRVCRSPQNRPLRQNTLSVIKHTNAITTANIYCIYQYASLDWPDGRTRNVLDLSLRLSVTNFIIRKQMTDFNANWHKSSPGARVWLRESGGKRWHEAEVVWKPSGDIILDPSSRVDKRHAVSDGNVFEKEAGCST